MGTKHHRHPQSSTFSIYHWIGLINCNNKKFTRLPRISCPHHHPQQSPIYLILTSFFVLSRATSSSPQLTFIHPSVYPSSSSSLQEQQEENWLELSERSRGEGVVRYGKEWESHYITKRQEFRVPVLCCCCCCSFFSFATTTTGRHHHHLLSASAGKDILLTESGQMNFATVTE